jgi:Protein of unknown function (DUF1552)
MSQFNRRNFLRGAAGISVGLPFLAANPRPARSADAPKRLIVVFVPNAFFVPGHYEIPAASYSSTLTELSPILQPLAPFSDQLLVVDGVDNTAGSASEGGGHISGMWTMLTGRPLPPGNLGPNNAPKVDYPGGPSVDQVVAAAVGSNTKFDSLQFGVASHVNGGAGMVFDQNGLPIPNEDDPQAAFNRIFADLTADPSEVAAQREERATVLDAVRQDYAHWSGRLGHEDRQRLERHLQAIRDLEERLAWDVPVGASCTVPTVESFSSLYAPSSYGAIGRAQTDLMVQSLACDLTRVATLQWSHAGGDMIAEWLGHSEGHHAMSHNTSDAVRAELAKISTWYAEQLAYLLAELDAVDEGGSSLLDNTVVLWCSEVGEGNGHYKMNQHHVLAGSCGGFYDTGRHVTYNDVQGNYSPTAHLNDLLLSLCHAMDVPLDGFGDPAHGTGSPLTKLT